MRKLAYLTLVAGLMIGTTALRSAPVRPVAVEAKIAELTKQLTGTNPRDRETAAKELETIGEPALKAVTELTKSDNAEVAKLAKELKAKIEASIASKQLLAPTYVDLNFKDTPVSKVLEELNKQSNYNIVIVGDVKKIGEKKISIDTTGKIPFWKALDLFCEKAGLIESDGISGEMLPGGPGGIEGPIQIQPFPGGGIQIRPGVIRIAPQPVPAPAPIIDGAPAKPADDVKPLEKPAKPAVKPAVRPAVVRPAAGFQAVEIQIAPANDAAPRPAPVAPPIGGGAPGIAVPGGTPAFPGNVAISNRPTIVLTEGKAGELSKDYQGAIRVRSLPAAYAQNFRGIIPNEALGVLLQFQAEPKLQLNNITNIKITKAIDDNDQTLKNFEPKADGMGGDAPAIDLPIAPGAKPAIGRPAVRPAVRPVAFLGNGMIFAQLEKGEKESTLLKELTGTATAKIRTEAEVFVTVDNLTKAKGGEPIKGQFDSTIRITEVKKQENGTYRIEFELVHNNTDLQLSGKPIALDAEDLKLLGADNPAGNPAVPPRVKPVPLPAPAVPLPGGAVPLPAPAVPLPAPVDPPVRIGGAAPLAEVDDAKVAPPAGGMGGGVAPPVPPVAGPIGGEIGIAPPVAARAIYDPFQLNITDEKGKAYKVIAATIRSAGASKRDVDGKVSVTFTRTASIIVRPTEKEQGEPVKLTASAATMKDVEIPFTLKNVKLK